MKKIITKKGIIIPMTLEAIAREQVNAAIKAFLYEIVFVRTTEK